MDGITGSLWTLFLLVSLAVAVVTTKSATVYLLPYCEWKERKKESGSVNRYMVA